MNYFYVFFNSIFVLAASCYLLFMISDKLESVGGYLGKLLHIKEDVVAATFQALATSGPEIIMAIYAVVFVTSDKACSGLLNMSFSAMDNLLGIGCVGMVYMIYKGFVEKEELVTINSSVQGGLLFYILSSTLLFIFIRDFNLDVIESWILMIIAIIFVICQFFLPSIYKKLDKNKNIIVEIEQEERTELPVNIKDYFKLLLTNSFFYAFLVFALWIFVRECLHATFSMASLGIASIAGVLIMFTSYVSSFPEFMLTYQYASKGKKDALLSMLFGSNIIDLGFAGFRCIWKNEPMQVVAGNLFPYYIAALPLVAIFIYYLCIIERFRYKHAYPLIIFYLIYIVSGFILL